MARLHYSHWQHGHRADARRVGAAMHGCGKHRTHRRSARTKLFFNGRSRVSSTLPTGADRSMNALEIIQVPTQTVQKWQEIIDLLAEILHVPSALIMKVEHPNIRVFVSSETEGIRTSETNSPA